MKYDPRSAVSTYVEQEIRGESPLARVARVYEMARLETARAQLALGRGDAVAKGLAVNKASRCISALQSALNMEAGGEVAQNLDRIYGYLLNRLSVGHSSNDAQAFEEVAHHLSELGEAWRDAAARQQAAAVEAERPLAVAAAR